MGSIIPDTENERINSLINQMNKEKLSTQKAKELLEELKGYDINNFDLRDFFMDGGEVGAYFVSNPFHAARIYWFCLNYIISKTIDSKEREDYAKEFIRYLKKQIGRIEKDGSENLIYQLDEFLSELLFVYLNNKDTLNVHRTFKKLIKIMPNIELESKSWEEYAKWHTELITKGLTEFISNSVPLIHEAGIKIFGGDIRLMDSFLDAIFYAGNDEPVLILGETGTGKELIARIIHSFSKRRGNNFWAVNCGGFTESLFNSEVFGIISGAATHATTRLGAFLTACENKKEKSGYFLYGKRIGFRMKGKSLKEDPTDDQLKEIGGTLFLDEINSLDPGLQSKLLRVIQEREVQVVGEDFTRKFNCKLIFASNDDLEGMDKENEFREDLYYRISRGIVRLPSIKDMKDSIPRIANFQLDQLKPKLGIEEDIGLSGKAKKVLKSHSWPGNFREMENVLSRALKRAFLAESKEIKPEHIENLSIKRKQMPAIQEVFSGKKFDEVKKMYYQFVYEKEADRSVPKTAKIVGRAEASTRKMLKKLGLIA
jgi:transcriptional regulator of acetoin/glycerol metabolism